MHLRREGGPRQKGSVSASPDPAPLPIQPSRRRVSEESIRTELCDGPIPDSPPRPATPEQPVARAVADRAELIKRLKRGESPTWIPNRHVLGSRLSQSTASSPPGTPRPPHSPSPGLLPSATITPERLHGSPRDQVIDSPMREGLTIERPPSALHSGNFTPDEPSPDPSAARDATHPSQENRFRSASDLWMSTSPPADFEPFSFRPDAANYRREAFKSPGPSSLSSSLSSSFVYKLPTSPLVQSESNEDPDLTLPLASFNIKASSPRTPRRHTLNFSHSPFTDTAAGPRQATLPYQAHQPRRSLNSTPGCLFAGTSPQTPPVFHSRRPSFTSEASPLQHASMVGSYEESILRGRMSTTPSKPLEFTAQIGVLGLGKCKPNLRCPAHVTLPFSAVFYSYASTSHGRSKMEDGPSPYVGQIDLENGLPNPDDAQRAKRKRQSRYHDCKGGAPEEGPPAHESAGELSEGDGASKPTKSKRRSRSPKAPPGGCYRIPEKGQLQIIIKNQNKTAVKLFLVPYDLAGMEPGTKTFIRQRSYSAGPAMEPDIPNVKDPGGAADRPTLRYLVHLHICSPSRGRYYLYKSIRLVFANRVPDDKERLRNEVTYPDPRFTPYKPMRAMHPTLGIGHGGASTTGLSSGGASLAAAQVFRRRSVGFSLAHHHHPSFHAAEAHTATPQTQTQTILPGRGHDPHTDSSGNVAYSNNSNNNNTTTTTTTTTITANATATTPTPELQMTDCPPFSPSSSPSVPPPSPFAASITLAPTSPADAGMDIRYAYNKLSRGDVGYGGGSGGGRGGTPNGAGAEGLLSKRLRSLGVKAPPDGP